MWIKRQQVQYETQWPGINLWQQSGVKVSNACWAWFHYPASNTQSLCDIDLSPCSFPSLFYLFLSLSFSLTHADFTSWTGTLKRTWREMKESDSERQWWRDVTGWEAEVLGDGGGADEGLESYVVLLYVWCETIGDEQKGQGLWGNKTKGPSAYTHITVERMSQEVSRAEKKWCFWPVAIEAKWKITLNLRLFASSKLSIHQTYAETFLLCFAQ